jgi:hypothetical protein
MVFSAQPGTQHPSKQWETPASPQQQNLYTSSIDFDYIFWIELMT